MDVLTDKAKSKKSVFCVMGLKILGGVGTHIFFLISFFWKKYNFMLFFSENLKKILGFTSKFRLSGYPKHRYFLFGLIVCLT